tara:strand:+ start:30 stop:236 length:207 start_codon:yes stop_codon:yes gene_type:complete
MDLLKDLIKINNEYYLNEISKDMEITEKEKFIKEYNKNNNRLFTKTKYYTLDNYQNKIDKYQSRLDNK